MKLFIFLILFNIIAIAISVAYFTNMSEIGLMVIAGLGGVFFLIIGLIIGFGNPSVNKYR